MSVPIIGETHVNEQEMQAALRGAFLEGFKEGVSISQRSMFASTFLEDYLHRTPEKNRTEDGLRKCWDLADQMNFVSKPKKIDQH